MALKHTSCHINKPNPGHARLKQQKKKNIHITVTSRSKNGDRKEKKKKKNSNCKAFCVTHKYNYPSLSPPKKRIFNFDTNSELKLLNMLWTDFYQSNVWKNLKV